MCLLAVLAMQDYGTAFVLAAVRVLMWVEGNVYVGGRCTLLADRRGHHDVMLCVFGLWWGSGVRHL